MTVILTGAVTVAVAGYLTGTARSPARSGYHLGSAPGTTTDTTRRAPRQAEMAQARYEGRIAQFTEAFRLLGELPRGAQGSVRVTEAERVAAVASRAERRAYDGAPPTIPHAVDQRGLPACVVCHERGMRVNGRVAPAMSHGPMASCLQCHAPSGGVPGGEARAASLSTASTFAGLEAPIRGERAQPGAPPQIPHRTFMRERCESCHGTWASGLAVSHPERQSCTQCHALSSALDQRPRSTLAPLGWGVRTP